MTKQKRTTSLQRRQDRRLAALTKSGAPGPKLLADLFNKPIEEMRAKAKYYIVERQACEVTWRFPVEADSTTEAFDKYGEGDHGAAEGGPEIGDSIDHIEYDLEIEGPSAIGPRTTVQQSNEAQLRKDRTTTTKLEHRHFATIATIISSMPDAARRGEVAKHFAVQLGETNRKFDRERFIRACLEEK